MSMRGHENSVCIHKQMEIEFAVFTILCTVLISPCLTNNVAVAQPNVGNSTHQSEKLQSLSQQEQPYLGINMRGYYTSLAESRESKFLFPNNYYESSFQILSETPAIDHVRYRFYWESYIKNPTTFMKEIEHIANTADKYEIKVIYDNHQFHTSSWLNGDRGTGFPHYLFNDSILYKQNSGGSPKSNTAKTWWSNWWNDAIRVNGTDGWKHQLDFLKKIVNAVEKHPSTLGYEILSEPQVHAADQWSKIGKYNTFITSELRKLTNKTIIYSMNIPIDLKSPIDVNASNLAKMFPMNKENVVFKFSMYGIPSRGYQGDKFQLFEKAGLIAGVPLYIGEWNNVKRVEMYNERGEKVWYIDPSVSDINQAVANKIVNNFRNIGIWGLAFWEWSFIPSNTPNFNLVNITYDNETGEGMLHPTKYYQIVKNAYEQLYD
jgi:hypothetical protein